MKHWNWQKACWATVIVCLSALIGCSAFAASRVAGALPDPENELRRAWQRARDAGSYHFGGDLEQTTIPAATIANVGLASRQSSVHLEGDANLPARNLNFTLWSQGTLLDERSGTQFRVEGDQSYARQGDQPWQEIDDVSGSFAPGSDVMGFLAAAKNVKRDTSDVSRFTFDLDGPAFARYVRDRLTEKLDAANQLPPGASMELLRQYVEMTGQGEAWVDERGLPIYQAIHMAFPPQENGDTVKADLSMTFVNFGAQAAAAPATIDVMRMLGQPQVTWTWAAALFLMAVYCALRRAGRSRRVYAGVVIFISVMMVAGPLAQQVRAENTLREFASRNTAAQERQKETDAQRKAEEKMQVSRIAPNAPLVGTQNADHRTQISAVLPYAPDAILHSPEVDPALDTDKDGLPDVQENALGTNPKNADTDGDTLTDTLEVEGFYYNGKQWYLDPLQPDTNKDGLPDGQECRVDAGKLVCPDTDGDGTPDVWSRDNDGDGVPDDLDLSPFQKSPADQPFDENNPLSVQIDNLISNTLTYVEFQIRPTNPDHLRQAFNVFQWPKGDTQGQMMDIDGKTFKDVNPSSTETADAFGNVKLIPMLEIQIDGQPDNLPPTTTLQLWGISVHPLSEDGSKKAAYVPLQLVVDQGDNRVAFYAKMVYLPAQTWGKAHQVRLVWMAIGLNDQCKSDGWDSKGFCNTFDPQHMNETVLLTTYPDAFTLTGLHVREDHGVDWALIYKDPAAVAEPKTNETNRLGSFTDLVYGLDVSFLAGRVDKSSKRDMTLNEIKRRFDRRVNQSVEISPTRFGITDNVYLVDTFSFTHLDEGLAYLAITGTNAILTSTYTALWKPDAPVTPTVLFAREERLRPLNLDSAADGTNVAWDGRLLKLNLPQNVPPGSPFAATPEQTSVTLHWAPYKFQDGKWSTVPLDVFLKGLIALYRAEAGNEPADAVEGALLFVAGCYAAIYQGQSGLVKMGETFHPAPNAKEDGGIWSWLEQVKQRVKPYVLQNLKFIAEAGKLLWHSLSTWENFVALDVFTAFKAKLDGVPLPENLQSQLKSLESFHGVGLTVMWVVAVLSLIWAIVNVVLLIFNISTGEWGKWITLGLHTALLALKAWQIAAMFKTIQDVVKAIKDISHIAISVGGYLKSFQKGWGISKVSIGIAVALIALAIGLFLYGWLSGDLHAGSLEWNEALAQLIASIIVIIIFAVIDSIPIFGPLITFLINILDTIFLYIFGHAWVTEGLTWIIKHYIHGGDVMAKIDTSSGDAHTRLGSPPMGLRAGNSLYWSFAMTTTASGKMPGGGAWWVYANPWYFSLYTGYMLHQTSLHYKLSTETENLPSEAGDMYGRWIGPNPSGWPDPIYITDTIRSEKAYVLNSPGINASLPMTMNIGYTIPYVECWGWHVLVVFVYVPVAVCYRRYPNGQNPQTSNMGTLDIYPATLDGFLQWNWANNATLPLPAPKDADGDGLISKAYGGNDPDDTKWDTDGDTLSDFYELTAAGKKPENGGKRFDPTRADTDGDGLRDDDEMRLSTDPAKIDSDGDGLEDLPDSQGFLFTYAPGKQTLVYTSATDPDADRDGISDYAEKLLYQNTGRPYNPRVWNENPLYVRVKAQSNDGFVAPGWTRPVTLTAANLISAVIDISGTAGISLPTTMSFPGPSRDFAVSYTLHTGDRVSWRAPDLTVASGLPSQKAPITATACGWLQPARVRLPFDEPAGATTFANVADPNGRYSAVCSGSSCPQSGVSGAPGWNNAINVGTYAQPVVIQDSEALAARLDPNAFALALWIKPYGSANFNNIAVAKGCAGQCQSLLSFTLRAIQPSDEVSKLTFDYSSRNASANLALCPANDSGVTWNRAGWNHLILTRVGQAFGAYINGKPARLSSCAGAAALAGAVSVSEADADYGSNIVIGYMPGLYDEVYLFDRPLSASDIKILSSAGTPLAPDLDATACHLNNRYIDPVVIDNDLPTSTITSLVDNQFINTPGVFIIGGVAKDPTSYVTQVEVSVDGGPWWPATGGTAWAFAWDTSRTGRHTLRTRATDVVGHVEEPPNQISIYIDRTPPGVTVNPMTVSRAQLNPYGDWVLPLTGTVSTFCAPISSVEMLVEGPLGNGWQTAVIANAGANAGVDNAALYASCLDGTSAASEVAASDAEAPDIAMPSIGNTRDWRIDYALPSIDSAGRILFEPSGVYTVSVRGRDALGNITLPSRYVTATALLDTASPGAAITYSGPSTTTITTTVTLAGLITDPGPVAAGVNGMELAFVPADSIWVVDQANLLLHLDEPAGQLIFADGSGNDNGALCATSPQCPASGVPGQADQAVRFDGRSALAVLDSSSLRITGSLSLAAWFSMTAQPATFQLLAGNRTSTGADGAYALYWKNGALTFGVFKPDHTVLEASVAQTFNDGRWHHVVGAYLADTGSNTSRISLFVDGALVASQPMPSFKPLAVTSLSFMLGANPVTDTDATVNYLTGDLDEVMLFPFALSGQQARAIYNLGKAPWVPATLAQPGSPATTWTYTIPEGIEGIFQVNGRGTDILGNRNANRNDWMLWRGLIDTLAPRVFITKTGATVACAAADLNLTESGYQCPCAVGTDDRKDFREYSEWFRTVFTTTQPVLYALTPSCQPGGSEPYTTRACDTTGRCAYTSTISVPAGLSSPAEVEGADLTIRPEQPEAAVLAIRPEQPEAVVLAIRPEQPEACTTIGVNRAVAETAPPYAALYDIQRLQAAWDTATLFLTWTGANWYGDGNLFIYLNAGAGQGSIKALNPYTSTSTNERDTVALPFPANTLIWLKDGQSAELWGWDITTSSWQSIRSLSAGEYQFSDASRADIAVPFADLGMANPANTSLDLVAFASDGDALRLWAAMPPLNPLNSLVLGNPTGDAQSPRHLSLANAYHWDMLTPGACASDGAIPGDGQYLDTDLRATLTTDPLAHIDGGRPNGIWFSSPAPQGDTFPPLAPGQTVTYTLAYRNAGPASAPDARLTVTATGALALPSGASVQVVDLGAIQPGAQGTLVINAVADPTRGDSGTVELALTTSLPGQPPVERLTIRHDIDADPPLTPTISNAWHADLGLPWAVDTTYVRVISIQPGSPVITSQITPAQSSIESRPGSNILVGTSYDASGTPLVGVELADPRGETKRITCQNAQPVDGLWLCPVDLGSATPGDRFLIRVQVTDPFGHISPWSDWRALLVGPPPRHFYFLPVVGSQ